MHFVFLSTKIKTCDFDYFHYINKLCGNRDYVLCECIASSYGFFEGVISDIGSKDPLSFATVQLLHGDEVHSVLSKDNGVFSFPSVHPGDYILRITYVGYDRYENGLH